MICAGVTDTQLRTHSSSKASPDTAAGVHVRPPAERDHSSSSTASSTSFSRPPLRRFDSLPNDEVAGEHTVLSSTRLLRKLAATLNELSVDCRLPAGARYHGNGDAAAATPDRKRKSPAASASYAGNATRPEIPGVGVEYLQQDGDKEKERRSQTGNHRSNTELHEAGRLACLSAAESDRRLSHRVTDGGDGMVLDIDLYKGPLGLGFCIDGGRDTPGGPAPITIKRIYKGTPAYRRA